VRPARHHQPHLPQDHRHPARQRRPIRPHHRRPTRTRPTIRHPRRLHGPQNRLHPSRHHPATTRLSRLAPEGMVHNPGMTHGAVTSRPTFVLAGATSAMGFTGGSTPCARCRGHRQVCRQGRRALLPRRWGCWPSSERPVSDLVWNCPLANGQRLSRIAGRCGGEGAAVTKRISIRSGELLTPVDG
jgi:hypothetical protein